MTDGDRRDPSPPLQGDLVEIWEKVQDSEYLSLLRDRHPFESEVDIPDHYVDERGTVYTTTYVITETTETGDTLHKVVMEKA